MNAALQPISTPRRRIPEWLVQLAAVGSVPSDSDDVRLRKATLTLSVEMITLAGFLWGAMYVALGQYRSSIFPFAYSVVSILNLLTLALRKQYAVFRFIQILAILWLPFLLHWSLGGFVASGAVMVWALLAPIGALLFHGIRPATGWFLAYLALAVFSAGIEGRVAISATPLPPSVRVAFFALNVGDCIVCRIPGTAVFRPRNGKGPRSLGAIAPQHLAQVNCRPLAARSQHDR